MTSRAVMVKRSPEKIDLWTAKIIADKPFRLATTAMANKAAWAIWAMLTKKLETGGQRSSRASCPREARR